MTQPPKPPRDANPAHDPQRPEDRTPEEKLRLVLEASALPEGNLGEFLRRHGIHEADLASWREAALEGLGERHRTQPRGSAGTDHRRVRELERELRRKDEALAEIEKFPSNRPRTGNADQLSLLEDEPAGEPVFRPPAGIAEKVVGSSNLPPAVFWALVELRMRGVESARGWQISSLINRYVFRHQEGRKQRLARTT